MNVDIENTCLITYCSVRYIVLEGLIVIFNFCPIASWYHMWSSRWSSSCAKEWSLKGTRKEARNRSLAWELGRGKICSSSKSWEENNRLRHRRKSSNSRLVGQFYIFITHTIYNWKYPKNSSNLFGQISFDILVIHFHILWSKLLHYEIHFIPIKLSRSRKHKF